jgi:short-subunit dehydrogenase
LPHLRDSGGMLVVVSSVQGRVGAPWHSGYSAAKHAVQGFCDTLRMEESEHGVEVLTVLAHWIRGTAHRERALGPDGRPRDASAHAHGGDAMSADEMAGVILRAIRRRRRSIYVPRYLWLLGLLAALAPGLADRLIMRRVARETRRT